MKHCAICLGLTLCLSLTIPALAQTLDITEVAKEAAASATTANVYLQVANGVDVYSATAAGKLTLVKGPPFSTSGKMEGVNGKCLISVGINNLHSYPIESNGGLGKQVSNINTQNDVEYESYIDRCAWSSSVPTISSNDRFAYDGFRQDPTTSVYSTFASFARTPSGVLDVNQNFSEIDPLPNPEGTPRPHPWLDHHTLCRLHT